MYEYPFPSLHLSTHRASRRSSALVDTDQALSFLAWSVSHNSAYEFNPRRRARIAFRSYSVNFSQERQGEVSSFPWLLR
jgi:hypothetical protein